MKISSEIQVKQLEEILELARTITSTFAWDEILESIVKKAVELIPGGNPTYPHKKKTGQIRNNRNWE